MIRKNADERRKQNDDNNKNFDGWNRNFVLVLAFWAYTRQKLNDSMALIWAFVSIALVITGAVPAVSKHLNESLLIFMFIICLLLLFLLFKVSKAVSVLSMKNQELAMQVSLLNQENERILHKLGILTDEKKDSVRD